jgi:hypothetical protein
MQPDRHIQVKKGRGPGPAARWRSRRRGLARPTLCYRQARRHRKPLGSSFTLGSLEVFFLPERKFESEMATRSAENLGVTRSRDERANRPGGFPEPFSPSVHSSEGPSESHRSRQEARRGVAVPVGLLRRRPPPALRLTAARRVAAEDPGAHWHTRIGAGRARSQPAACSP